MIPRSLFWILLVIGLTLAAARPGHAAGCTAYAPLIEGEFAILVVDCIDDAGTPAITQVTLTPAQVRNMYQLWQGMLLKQEVRPFPWPLWFTDSDFVPSEQVNATP